MVGVSAERDELRRLVEELPDEEVPAAVAELRLRVAPQADRPWPPPWFAAASGSRTDIGRTGMGVGVRDGAPQPDISSVDAFKRALLEAKSIVYVDPASGATSGTHFAAVLQKLGIADAVKAKTKLVPGGYPAELVAKGEVEMVVHQISEIVPVKGVTLVGPLPKELQKLTIYSDGETDPVAHVTSTYSIPPLDGNMEP